LYGLEFDYSLTATSPPNEIMEGALMINMLEIMGEYNWVIRLSVWISSLAFKATDAIEQGSGHEGQ
jgi:hypothetical protein